MSLCFSGDDHGDDSGASGSSFGDAVPLVRSGGSFQLNSGNLWLDAMAGGLSDIGIDARNLVSLEKKVESDESDLASLVLAADGQLQMLHRQTREARARDSSNLEPEYKLKLEATLEQVFVLSKSLVADVGHQAVQILTELKTLKDHNVLLVDQLSNVEGKVDSLVIKASAEPRPEHLHPDLIKTLSGVKSLSESVAKHLTGLEKKVDGLRASTEPQPRPDQHQLHPDLVKSLSGLHQKVEKLHPDLVKSLTDLKHRVESLAQPQPQPQPVHPDLVKSLSELKSKVDSVIELQPLPDQPAHPDLVKSFTELEEQLSQTNQSLSQQVASLIQKLDKLELLLKDSKDSDRLDECIRETVGNKPVFLQWMSWLHNLWYKEVPKHSSLWHPQVSKGSKW